MKVYTVIAQVVYEGAEEPMAAFSAFEKAREYIVHLQTTKEFEGFRFLPDIAGWDYPNLDIVDLDVDNPPTYLTDETRVTVGWGLMRNGKLVGKLIADEVEAKRTRNRWSKDAGDWDAYQLVWVDRSKK